MQDRLNELRRVVAHRNLSLAELLPPNKSAIYEVTKRALSGLGAFESHLQDPGGGGGGDRKEPTGKFMAEYLNTVNNLKSRLAVLSEGFGKFRDLKNKLVQTATPDEEKALTDEMHSVMADNNRDILNLKQNLEELRAANSSPALSSTEANIRTNMHSTLVRRFTEMLAEYQELQTDHKKSVRDKIERQVKIVYPDVSEYELTEILEGGDSSQAAQQHIMSKITGAHESLAYAYQDIQDKHRDVQHLEQNVLELHQMFVDLATLIDAQGQIVDQVESAVNNAVDYTEKADKDLVVVQKIQNQRKKWGCYISCCVVVLALIIVLPIIVFVAK